LGGWEDTLQEAKAIEIVHRHNNKTKIILSFRGRRILHWHARVFFTGMLHMAREPKEENGYVAGKRDPALPGA
jgi:hypothetical protein